MLWQIEGSARWVFALCELVQREKSYCKEVQWEMMHLHYDITRRLSHVKRGSAEMEGIIKYRHQRKLGGEGRFLCLVLSDRMFTMVVDSADIQSPRARN